MEDNDILSKLKSGDDTAFTELYNKYAKYMTMEVYHHLHDIEASKEVAQQMFCNWWETKSMHHLKLKTASLKTYIQTCCRLAVWKYKKQEKGFEPISQLDDISMIEDEKMEFDFKRLEVLSKIQKTAIRMVYLEEEKRDEICNALGIANKTLRNHLCNAIKTLRQNFNIGDFIIE